MLVSGGRRLYSERGASVTPPPPTVSAAQPFARSLVIIANIQTPGYRAQRVSFEDELSKAVRHGSGAVTAQVARSLEPTREDGNNVNLDTETLLNVDTNLRYQLATQAMDGQFSQIRTAMRTN